jgi:indolepyruvate ferredoxin oxidoreductase, alpha subunit
MKELMLGNEAVARGAWEAGALVISSYPGTPSTEITEFAAEYKELDCQWAPNEKVAVEVAYGAAFGGARAMSCMKHVGVNVAADPLFTAAYTGINAGLVIVCADDPGIHSSQNEQDSRILARAMHIPMLEPSDSAECLAYTRYAFELSEKYDTPVFLRLTTRVSHSRSPVDTAGRVDAPVGPYVKNIMKYVMMPGMARKRHIMLEEHEKRLEQDACSMPVNQIEKRDRGLGIVCSGVAYRYVREAFPGASTLKLGLTFPLARGLVREFSKYVSRLIVVEELEGILQQEIAAMGISVSGKEATGFQGELSVSALRERFGLSSTPAEAALPARPPVMCAGCPHRAVFYAIKKLGLHVFGDIGCYTLGALAPLETMDVCLCMGASIGMAIGAEKARGKDFSRKSVAVIGDSTFIHSGITPLINAVYGKSAITVVILDNSITGMTGHQQNPATGKDINGLPAPQLNLARLCEAVGARVRVINPFNSKEALLALTEETAADCVSVIIAQSPCALIVKSGKRPVRIQGCRNCGTCLTLGCPALYREGKSVYVNAEACTGCGLCVNVCAFGAITPESDGE